MRRGTCKFCHTTAELCASHIIPEFCYESTYDEKHRATVLISDMRPKRLIQKGLRDHLLCSSCEGYINDNFEKPFLKFWYARVRAGASAAQPPIPSVVASDDDIFRIKGFEYASFKLFHLSVLWRASVSETADFNTVSLGPYEGKIRKMLLDRDPGPTDHYPMFGAVLVDDEGNVCHGMVLKPQWTRYHHFRLYCMTYAGCEWYIVLTDQGGDDVADVMPFAPTTDGTAFLGKRHWRTSEGWTNFLSQARLARRRSVPL